MFKEIKNFHNIFLIQKTKYLVFLIFLCSFIINFLTIIVSFYSMQIFDFRNDLMQKINMIIQKKIINNFVKTNDINEKIEITQRLQKINGFFSNNYSINIFEITTEAIKSSLK